MCTHQSDHCDGGADHSNDAEMLAAIGAKRAEDWSPPPPGDPSEGQRPFAAYIPCPVLSSVYNARKILANVPDSQITLDTLVTYADFWQACIEGGGDDAFATKLASGVWEKMAGQDHLLVPQQAGPDVDHTGHNSHQLKLFRLLEMSPVMHGTSSGIRFNWRTLSLGFDRDRLEGLISKYDRNSDGLLDTSEMARFLGEMDRSVNPNFNTWGRRLQGRGVFAALCLAWGSTPDTIEVGIVESLFKGIYVQPSRVYSFNDVVKKMGWTALAGSLTGYWRHAPLLLAVLVALVAFVHLGSVGYISTVPDPVF